MLVHEQQLCIALKLYHIIPRKPYCTITGIYHGVFNHIIFQLTLENLFSILPNGVVSKNDIGDLSIVDNILSWRVREPFITPVTIRNVATNIKITWVTPNIEYTPRSTTLKKDIKC